jgi:hypothetical protein
VVPFTLPLTALLETFAVGFLLLGVVGRDRDDRSIDAVAIAGERDVTITSCG